MSGKRHQSEDTSPEKKPDISKEPDSFLKKRLIWQHLTQKKIKKALKARFKIDTKE
ncbi:hypothetical protein [Polynucleobacter sp. AP-Kaivos-20-H2]|uniref:hypothetical protein n=1 Tax=Polynucleobacter sp. AP-Kaivos-20-H2 TaxID=2689104 RepID=UPI001C0C2B34|nr:hypothetical protein [Polynucleobacter sp. AP-Kaivos-20-H2]MBU3603604.1 hypothetical protein [Polynucleobacter sp. AP-Kaivos-20-H2]